MKIQAYLTAAAINLKRLVTALLLALVCILVGSLSATSEIVRARLL